MYRSCNCTDLLLLALLTPSLADGQQSAAMYWQLLTQRAHWPALVMGITLGLLSVLLNPLTMSYVAYDGFRKGGFKLRMAVFVTNFCVTSSFAVGECGRCRQCAGQGRAVQSHASKP